MLRSKGLVRGLLMSALLVTLLGSPALFNLSFPAGDAVEASAAPSVISLVAQTGATPEYGGSAHLVRLQSAPLQQAAGDIVISEVRARGSNGGGDEFIELFNRNCTTGFNLNGWTVRVSDTGGLDALLYSFPIAGPTITLAPGQYYLLAPSGPNFNDGIAPDDTYAGGIDDDGGIALFLPDGTTQIDAVGLDPDTIYKEGTALTALTDDLDQGYRRVSSATDIFVDSDNNAADFAFLAASDPQNSGTTVPCGTPTPTDTPTITDTPTATNTATPTNTANCAALPVDRRLVVINEVAWYGTLAGTQNYWVELYNTHPTCSVNLNNWRLVGIRSGSQTFSITFGSSDVIASEDFLVVTRVSNTFDPVLTVPVKVSSQLLLGSAGQCLQLLGPGDALVDTANSNPLCNYPWPAGSTQNRRSMERLRLTADSQVNWVTFDRPPPFPSNWPTAPGNRLIYGTPGMHNWGLNVTLTPSPIPTKVKTPTPRPPTPFPHMVINEFLPRAGTDWNLDGVVNVYDEFIEIKNNGPINGDLKGWKLDDGAGQGSAMYTLPSVVLKPGERAVFYGLSTRILLNDSGDEVRLINTQGAVIDSRGYGVVEKMDESHCRIPDGLYWRLGCFPTPGNENALAGVAPAPVPIIVGGRPPCLLPDTVPLPFWEAECEAYGDDMWDRAFWDEPRARAVTIHSRYVKWKTAIR